MLIRKLVISNFRRHCFKLFSMPIKRELSVERAVAGDKRLCSGVKIGTHDGTFHCDEVLACAMLKRLPEFSEATIVRSRHEPSLEQCDIVVDVGAVYDPSKHRYDHHQRTFNESMNSLKSSYPWDTKLSSAGLVYFHFGHRVLSEVLNIPAESTEINDIYSKVYEEFVNEVDAIDNGISCHDGKARYNITTNLSSRVKRLNPAWNEKSSFEEAFIKAFELVSSEFESIVKGFYKVWLPARSIVYNAIETRLQTDSGGEIVSLGSGGCPWKDHIFAIEEQLNLTGAIKFVIFEDDNKNWRVQGVPVHSHSFELRLPLKSDWRGLRDEELSNASGIPSCIFVHASGFIGGNKTREGVLKMAKETIESSKS